MCKAIEFANSINNTIEEAKAYYESCLAKVKIYDDMQNDLLHEIESLSSIDLYEGWKFTKSLIKLREERRNNKNELHNMEILIEKLNKTKIGTSDIKSSLFLQEHPRYNNRIISAKRCSPIEIVDKSIEKINSKNNVSRNKLKDEVHEVSNSINNSNRIYYTTSKLPKTKGVDINMMYRSEKEKQHIVNCIAVRFENYELNEKNNIVKLINKIK